MADQRTSYNSNAYGNANTSGIRRDTSAKYAYTANSGISGNIGTNAAYNANPSAGSGYYNTGNAGSGYYAPGVGNANDRPVSYTTNNQVQDRPTSYTSNVNAQNTQYGASGVQQRSSTSKHTTNESHEKTVCSTPLLALLALIAIAGIVLGILFGVGVIGGKSVELHQDSEDVENGLTIENNDTTNINGVDTVDNEANTVTVDTTVIDTRVETENVHQLMRTYFD